MLCQASGSQPALSEKITVFLCIILPLHVTHVRREDALGCVHLLVLENRSGANDRANALHLVSSVSQPYRTRNRMIFCLTSGSRVLIFHPLLRHKSLRRVAADQNPERRIISQLLNKCLEEG